ncbi:YhdP family protein [Comamonas sp. NLF-1-9]|uniref:YhdP family protein n=1 Tax=Comamonas sp. NLF-1-9 TaxID=2853163 RepID=UPI001C442063|nr:YhdP family protein [Comamonas sp. NLF-1-9]QXL84055.1 TIGR02099 family protein [Comamonas sp. NLF-1-9]
MPTHSPRWLRYLASTARWALGILLAFWLLLALAWATLHWWIVPRIDDWRPLLQQQAQKALGLPVRVDRLLAHSEGVLPTLELQGVQLLDAQGRQALQLPRVLIALSPRSLLRLGLSQLYVQAPALQLRRDAQGQVFVAGLPLTQDSGEGSVLDWLLSQSEVVVRGGRLEWLDEQRALPVVELSDVDLVLRGGAWRHALRLDATPPAHWGARFSLRARLQEPLWDPLGKAWSRWSGQWYAELPEVDLVRLAPYLDLQGVQVQDGRGALRAWADVQQGRVARVVTDLALRRAQVQWARALQPLALQELALRAVAEPLEDGLQLGAENLRVRTSDGLAWQSKALSWRVQGQGAQRQQRLHAELLDLALLARIAERLPLEAALREALAQYGPEGRIHDLQAQWQGQDDAVSAYAVRGRASDLALGQGGAGGCAPKVFGLRGASGSFELSQTGGSAELDIRDGQLLLPGVFEDPCVPLQSLQASVRWQIEGEHIRVDSENLRFANADAEGRARLHWRTGEGAQPRLPGMLDLSGTLVRADGTRVHRYLPLAVDAEARHYVRDAITAGASKEVNFRVRGDLADLPFANGEAGEFHIAARIRDATLVYVPRALQTPGDKPWPALSGLSGMLVFDRASMRVDGAAGQVQGRPRLKVLQVDARIPDLQSPQLQVQGEVQGPLAEMLAFVRGSQVADLTEGALDQMQARGEAALQLKLRLPIAALQRSRVEGRIALAGNELRPAPGAPLLTQLHGAVAFSERGFTLEQVRAQALGGELQLTGGLQPAPGGGEPQLQLQARGRASSAGLHAAAEPGGLLARLAARLQGSADYQLALGMHHGLPEVRLTSDLAGMALDLPAPLGKTAEQPLALRYENRISTASAAGGELREQLQLELGERLSLSYLQKPAAADRAPQVLAGQVVLGGGKAVAGESGVHALVRLDALDLDAWEALEASAAGGSRPARSPWQPDTLELQVGTLTVRQRQLHELSAHARARGESWNAELTARELQGQLAYQAPDAAQPQGLVRARLARLSWPKAEQAHMDRLLDADAGELPALDVQVQDFELHGHHLGQLDLQAVNRNTGDGQREWRLSRLNLEMPEASFSSSGNWALLGHAGPDARRRTVLKFELKLRDSGELLARLGMPGVLRRGAGELQGSIGWLGPPVAPDYASMTGEMKLDMQSGQFLKADPGLSKLLGVLSLQALPRRFSLDFRDVFSAGFSFDFVRADLQIEQGVARTNNLQMKGVNAAVLMEGTADIAHETQNLHVVVVPELNTLTASLVATAINPVLGLGSFLAQFVLGDRLVKAATREFQIEGTWSEPQVRALRSGADGTATHKEEQP